MSDILCWLIGALIAISAYLMLSKQIMRWLFGIVILTSTVNIVLLLAGRLYSQQPAFVSAGETSFSHMANPLPQALILTAIVIGFGLLSFALVLARIVWREFKTTNMDHIQYSEAYPIRTMEDDE